MKALPREPVGKRPGIEIGLGTVLAAVLLHTLLVAAFVIDWQVPPAPEARPIAVRLVEEPPRDVYIKSAEDTVLRKLAWYKLGGGVSERQWTDVLGVLKVQGKRLDTAYMHKWADALGVRDLLDRAQMDA